MSTFFPNSGTSVALPVSIANGGSGQVTAGAAFDALSPTTTNGDLIAQIAGADSRLAIGTAGQVLTVAAGLPAWASPALTVAALGADVSNSTTTAAKITGLDVAVGVGTWKFEYSIIHQAAATTTGIAFSVNHTGTLTRFVAVSNYVDTGTTNLNNAQRQAATTPTYIGGVGARVKSATANMGPTTSVDTANADMLTTLEGVLVVTVSGNIELYFASEVAAQTTVKQNSILVMTKII